MQVLLKLTETETETKHCVCCSIFCSRSVISHPHTRTTFASMTATLSEIRCISFGGLKAKCKIHSLKMF